MMKRSAQGEQQKMNILSNELIRRLSNVCGSVEFKETIGVIDHYSKQLKNSGYGWEQAREVVICGLKGYKNKCERRQKAGDNFDRKAGKTVQGLERQHGSRVRRKKKRWAASKTSRGEGS